MHRRQSTITALAGLMAATALSATSSPAEATPPHAEDVAVILAVFPDLDNGLVGFVNVTRQDFCAWLAGGTEGPPPLIEATSPAWETVRGDGVVNGTAMTTVHMELWALDPGADLSGPCIDTDEATEPFATGTTDVYSSERGLYDTFNGHGTAGGQMRGVSELTGPEGQEYRYTWFAIEVVRPDGTLQLGDLAHNQLIRLP